MWGTDARGILGVGRAPYKGSEVALLVARRLGVGGGGAGTHVVVLGSGVVAAGSRRSACPEAVR